MEIHDCTVGISISHLATLCLKPSLIHNVFGSFSSRKVCTVYSVHGEFEAILDGVLFVELCLVSTIMESAQDQCWVCCFDRDGISGQPDQALCKACQRFIQPG